MRDSQAPAMLTAAEVSFIRAIADGPDDDLNRLGYADWLEEQGNPHGEFIRVQLQLDRMDATDPRRPPLEQRQRELEDATSFAEWKGQLSRYGFSVRCRRGFVDGLVFDLARWPELTQESSLRFTARLTRPSLDVLQSLLSPARRFVALPATLRIQADWNYVDYGCEREVHVPPEGAAELLALPCFANLNGLEIGNGAVVLAPQTVRAVVSHPNLGPLRQLSLNGHPVGEGGCLALVSAGRLTNLTALRLCGASIDDRGVTWLAASAALAKLTELDLRNNAIGDEGAAALAGSAHLRALTKLKLSGNRIGPDGTAALRRRFGAACLLPQLQRSPPRPGDWYCYECSANNFSSREVCHECRSPRPKAYLREGDWLCPGCKAHNFARRQTCFRCKATRQA